MWFASSKEVACKTCWRSDWWVWIDVPDETPEYNLSDDEPYPGNYALPIEYVNTLEVTFEAEV